MSSSSAAPRVFANRRASARALTGSHSSSSARRPVGGRRRRRDPRDSRSARAQGGRSLRSEEHTSELQSLAYLVCRLLLEKKKNVAEHVDDADESPLRGT